jgi:hypothetical protein
MCTRMPVVINPKDQNTDPTVPGSPGQTPLIYSPSIDWSSPNEWCFTKRRVELMNEFSSVGQTCQPPTARHILRVHLIGSSSNGQMHQIGGRIALHR